MSIRGATDLLPFPRPDPDFLAFCASFLARFTFDLQPVLLPPPSFPLPIRAAVQPIGRTDRLRIRLRDPLLLSQLTLNLSAVVPRSIALPTAIDVTSAFLHSCIVA